MNERMNAQYLLDLDRENVEVVTRKLRAYCKALAERISNYYWCMDTESKKRAMNIQRKEALVMIDHCTDFLSYWEDGDDMEGGPWVEIDRKPLTEEEVAEFRLDQIVEAIQKEEAK